MNIFHKIIILQFCLTVKNNLNSNYYDFASDCVFTKIHPVFQFRWRHQKLQTAGIVFRDCWKRFVIFNNFPLKFKYSTLQNFSFSKTRFFELLGKIKIISKGTKGNFIAGHLYDVCYVALNESILGQNFDSQFGVG